MGKLRQTVGGFILIVVVLGMHRSGTSLVSSILHNAFGVSMIPDMRYNNFDPTQPNGYWEDSRFKTMNNDILKLANGSWKNPTSANKILDLFKSETVGLHGKMSRLIRRREEESPIWGFKDPRTCLTFLAWDSILTGYDLRLVVTRRKSSAIVNSLDRRAKQNEKDILPVRKWRGIVRHYDQQINTILSFVPYKVVFIEFEKLTSADLYSQELKKLAGLVGAELTSTRKNTAKKIIRFK